MQAMGNRISQVELFSLAKQKGLEQSGKFLGIPWSKIIRDMLQTLPNSPLPFLPHSNKKEMKGGLGDLYWEIIHALPLELLNTKAYMFFKVSAL